MDDKQALREELKETLRGEPHRIGSHSDDYGGSSDNPCYCTVIPALEALIDAYTEQRQKLHCAENHPKCSP